MVTKILRYLLITTIVFLSISGIYGGLALIINPNGALLSLPIWFLDNTIFANYLIPGIILLLFIGFFPALAAYGLIFRRQFYFVNKINLFCNRYWAWTYALYSGIILIFWIDFQIMIIGYGHLIQIIYAFLGVLIIILSLIPSNMRYYKIKKNKCTCKKKKRKK